MATRADQAAWSAHVATLHPVAARLHDHHGPLRLGTAPRPAQRFTALSRAVCFQQLAGAAASTIWSRVLDLVGADLTPATIVATPFEDLRACGLSRAKAATIVALAEAVLADDVRLEHTGRMSDDDVIAMLTSVRGIGRWTAEMFLMFNLHRADIWPVGDLGVRTGFGYAFDLPAAPTAPDLLALGAPFSPYRTVLAWWCWREVDERRASATASPVT